MALEVDIQRLLYGIMINYDYLSYPHYSSNSCNDFQPNVVSGRLLVFKHQMMYVQFRLSPTPQLARPLPPSFS
jgi:hypothetical protein